MKIAGIVLGVFLTLFISNIAIADGNELVEHCNSAIKLYEGENSASTTTEIGAGLCLGVLDGFRSLNTFYEAVLEKDQLFFCIPTGVTNGQLAKVVVKYLNDNPSELHEPATALIWTALFEAFPCN